MERIIIRILLIIQIICVLACSQSNKAKNIDKTGLNGMNFPDFKESNEGLGRAVSLWDSLEITVEFPDCGEWVGRIEKIVIIREKDFKLKAQFTMDTLCCDGIDSLNIITRSNKINVTTTLKPEDENLVNLFIHRILELNLNLEYFTWGNEQEPESLTVFANEPIRIEIRNTTGELYLSFLNIDQLGNTWYNKLRNQIFGELAK